MTFGMVRMLCALAILLDWLLIAVCLHFARKFGAWLGSRE